MAAHFVDPTEERRGKPSASSMDRIIACNASFLREREAGERESASLRASRKRGDRIHERLRQANPEGLSYSDNKLYERIAWFEALLVHQHSFEGAEVIRETRFWYSEGEIGEEVEWVFSAKPDVIYLLNGRALVINYKTGESVPTPLPTNYQVLSECALIAYHYRLYEVVGALIHPKLKDRGTGPDHQFYIYSGQRLLEKTMPLLIRNSRNVLNANLAGVPGQEQCEYCDAAKMGLCEEFKKWK